ncbi:probable tubulin polyglutamylase ttll-15 [Oppia nitens]|uniref:probable tubulin polyglutamylase ttll-15 n=1 Tax=Oppia nitens TaxID=1686743 RepID=UPI0023DBD0A7|nr:probable tubulin polyglutamylase ttll-15 [Oppia nitens]
MSAKLRRSPVPSDHFDKNERSERSSSENRLTHDLMSSNKSLSKRLDIITALVAIAVFITVYNFYGLTRLENQRLDSLTYSVSELVNPNLNRPVVTECQPNDPKPIAWISGQRLESGYLDHVIDVFDKIGYQITYNGSDEWDVLWSHDYPFMRNFLPTLKSHQRVNHFPGSGFITNKVNLATSRLKHIPLAFNLPNDKDKFVEHSKMHPNKLWVKKDSNHRGIRILDLETVNLSASGTFMQEYIQKPYLIDGKKFDIGIYAIMTSINPLRVYILESDALLRFCAKPYYPFNSSDVDTYVVGDDYTPTWMMPSLRKYFIDLNMNMKESFNGYLRSLKKDPTFVWKQIEDSIKTVYYTKEEQMLQLTAAFLSTRHFFELVRFDFALDEDLNVYLMEANMSPNLSSAHFGPNKMLYEQVIFNLLSLVGVARTLNTKTWVERDAENYNIMVSTKDLSVNEELCSSDKCHLSCKSKDCDVCYHCLRDDHKLVLKDAFLEHNSKWNTKRLIPSTTDEESDLIKSEENIRHLKWFKGKCQQNKLWC